ncbi:hypothetical protein ABW19_dt0207121 [Dactylella cylindrospora]|nr:hypothetical protein ABW19_dt0207121 [Dactylella cylindrospora]
MDVKGKDREFTFSAPTPGKKPQFSFFGGKPSVVSPAASTPSPSKAKYTDPEKAAIIQSLKEDATYDDLWSLCWEINIAFMTKAPVNRSRCMKCNTSLADSDGRWHSGFISQATYSSCGHASRGGFCVCTACDEDLLFDVSTVKVECFEAGCKETIRVNRSTLTDKLGKERPKLLEDYLALLNKYHDDSFTCCICFEEVERRLQPQGKIAPGCNHTESMCCLDCLAEMMDSNVRNAMWGDIKCPECQAAIDTDGVKRFASEEAYIKFEKFQLNKALEGDEEFRWCPRLDPVCGHGQLHPERDAQPRVICAECDFHHCFSCRVPWHSGMTCIQYQASKQNSESETYIQKISKRCPARGCGVPIEKQERCLEVKHEGGCNTNFCWDCKAILGFDIPHSDRVTSRHFESCRAKEVRHSSRATFADKPPAEGNDTYRDGWSEDPGYERSDFRDGAYMYCRGTCSNQTCKDDPPPPLMEVNMDADA